MDFKVVGTLERWRAVVDAWKSYCIDAECSDAPDSLVNMMIQVDSFSGFCDVRGLLDLKPLVVVLEQLIAESSENIETIEEQIAAISEMVSFLADPDSGNLQNMPSFLERTKDHPKTVVIYSLNHERAGEFSMQLEHYGYRTFIYGNIRDAIVAAVMTKKADAAIIDFSDGIDDVVARELSKLSDSRVPWVVISPDGQFETRLSMVRSGCSSFFVEPVSASMLADRIDSITYAPAKNDPYRVLIVDDGKQDENSARSVLNDAGMVTWSISDPTHVIIAIQEFYPDLIILDLENSSCSDVETAKVIRQEEAYASIPVVYLSSERSRSKQLDALRLGGDDFLIKPIHGEHLIAAITSKAERYRLLRKMMIQDSLTGLLNHTQTKQKLQHVLQRGEKEGKPVCFVMLDIDFFKKVNDSYGHAVGDVVIKSLARLLRQRLRKTDIVGRYGGEEFAVVLYGADGPQAVGIMDRIRVDFSGIYHHYEGGIFASTFSCGVAAYPQFENSVELGRQADEALYAAKRGGRNRVVLATRQD